MRVIVNQRGTKWYARVEQDGLTLVESHSGEPRVGCAVRQVLNKLQVTYGAPADQQVILTIDEW